MTTQTAAFPIPAGVADFRRYCEDRASAKTTTSIVVPCFNEARRLDGPAFLDFLDASANASLVFVDDGSDDETLSVLSALQSVRPGRIQVLSLSRNAGKAEAVRHGLQHALDRGADLVGYWDADLATPLDAVADFERVARRLQDVEVIFGARRQLLGHRIERSALRRTVSRICALLARLAVRLPIGDTQCGAKLFRNTRALRSALRRPFTAGWLFDVELLARIADRANDRRRVFYELPLAEWTEIPGSKVSGRAILRSAGQMLCLIAQRRLGLPIAVPRAAAQPVSVQVVEHTPRLVAMAV